MTKTNNQKDVFAYLPVVVTARLGRNEKILLFFYAWSFNWKKRKPSHYSTGSICAYLSMSKNTYYKARNRLEELGWIIVKNKGQQSQCEVTVQMGVDDPEYDNKNWANKYPVKTKLLKARDHFIQTHPEMVWEPIEMIGTPQLVLQMNTPVPSQTQSVSFKDQLVLQQTQTVSREETNKEDNNEDNDEW